MAFNVSASVWESDVNVSNNTSVVHVRVNITSSGESHSYNNLYGTITIDGNDYTHGAYQVPYNANLTFESTRTITHNADGAKSVNWSYSFQVKSNDTRTGSGSITLTTIARASQPSCITWPNTTQNIGNVGDTIAIHMNRKSPSFTHKVTYTLGSKSDVIATNVTDNCSWQIPLNLANYITNAKSGNGTIYAETFNGSTSIGKKSVSFTVNIPNTATFKPTMSLSITPSGQFKSKYLNKVSGVTVSATTGGKYNATISSYSISGLSKTASKANLVVNPINENLTNASQSFTISGSVTDSRGYTNTASTSITVYRYNAPQITQCSVQRCTSDGTISNSGTYAKVEITYKYQNDGYSNTMPTKKININNTDYNLTTKETTSNGVVTGTGYTVVGGGNLAITNKYNYTITCIDEVGKSIKSQGVLNTSERIVSIRPQGKGIAFGMFAITDNLVESAWKIKSTNGFEGNASSATNANNVNIEQTNLTNGNSYYIPFTTEQSGNQIERANDGLKYYCLNGTAGAVGTGELCLGNSTNSGTAGNKRGHLRLMSEKSGSVCLRATADSTAQRWVTFPDLGGTAVVKQSDAITKETNGWYKVNFGAFTLYFKNGDTASKSFEASAWSYIDMNLPSGITYNDARMLLFGNAKARDNAIRVNFCVFSGGNQLQFSWHNAWSEAVTTTIRYNLGLIVFP